MSDDGEQLEIRGFPQSMPGDPTDFSNRSGRADDYPAAPDHRSTVPGQQLKAFDTLDNVLREHRMPDTQRPVVHDNIGGEDVTRLGSDHETVQALANEFYNPDRGDEGPSVARWFPTVHVRTADGGYRAGSSDQPMEMRGLPGDARPEIMEQEQSARRVAQMAFSPTLASQRNPVYVKLAYHTQDDPPESFGGLNPASLAMDDRVRNEHDIKDALRRMGDQRQRQAAVPGPWLNGEAEEFYATDESGATRAVRPGEPAPIVTSDPPNAAQTQGVMDLSRGLERRETLRRFYRDLS